MTIEKAEKLLFEDPEPRLLHPHDYPRRPGPGKSDSGQPLCEKCGDGLRLVIFVSRDGPDDHGLPDGTETNLTRFVWCYCGNGDKWFRILDEEPKYPFEGFPWVDVRYTDNTSYLGERAFVHKDEDREDLVEMFRDADGIWSADPPER